MTDFEAGNYTGPVKPPKEEMEKWYHRFKDFCNPIQQRGFGIVAHPDEKGLIKDSLERMQEDETWPHGREVPPAFFTPRVQAGQLMPCDHDTMKVLTMSAVTGAQKGFGRFAGLYLPGSAGLHNPWSLRGQPKPQIETDEQQYKKN
jgi:hypothetical protein